MFALQGIHTIWPERFINYSESDSLESVCVYVRVNKFFKNFSKIFPLHIYSNDTKKLAEVAFIDVICTIANEDYNEEMFNCR